MFNKRLDHQITGARQPITLIEEIKDDSGKVVREFYHEFLMSPMTDKDLSELDLWLQSRYLNQTLESSTSPDSRKAIRKYASTLSAWSGEGLSMMQCEDGAARMLWQAIHRNNASVSYESLRRLMQSDKNKLQFNEVFNELNSVDFSQFISKTNKKDGDKQPKPSKALIYCVLAEAYKYTFDEIANMTPLQQFAAMTRGGEGTNVVGEDNLVYFTTYDEYVEWLATRN